MTDTDPLIDRVAAAIRDVWPEMNAVTLRRAAVAAVEAARPEGWKLAPVEPTTAMLKALWEAKDGAELTLDRAASGDTKAMRAVWTTMLSASPSPEDAS